MSFYEPIKMKVSYGRPPARTGKDYGLPEEYADWVEVEDLPDHSEANRALVVKVTLMNRTCGELNRNADTRYYIPPKPKPTLPDVSEGAVIRFRCKAGSLRRAIRGQYGGWRVFEKGAPVLYRATFPDHIVTDATLLEDVAGEVVVELEGLG